MQNLMKRQPAVRVGICLAALLSVSPFASPARAQTVTRGPYLQIGTPKSVTVCWRTSVATNSKVLYGPQPGSLNANVVGTASVTDHKVTLTGLSPSTRYYYAIGSTTQLLAGNDTNHFFFTSPPLGDKGKTRIWVLGDSGTANSSAQSVRNAYYSYAGSTNTDVWLMLGDNAYPDGTDSDYQSAVFNMYPTMLRKSVLWPTLGNHDGHSADSGSQSGPYYNIFNLPKAGEAGGLASGTEAYYSFNRGQIHFVCLDSYDSSRKTGGAMMTWLTNDLKATLQPWTIAFWHHPPYSKGSHDSDSEVELIEMRQYALPILEAHGVDLVLCGHSHSYERSFLINGHYGKSSTFSSSMKVDGGNGRVGGTGAYSKPSAGPAGNEGAVYVVAGSSGKTESGSLNHPAMFISMGVLGSLVIDVEGSRLDAFFLTSSGKVGDQFTIEKGSTVTAPQPPAAPGSLQAQEVSASTIDLSWQDLSTTEDGFSVEMCPQGGAWAQLGSVAANVKAYAATGLAPLSTYSFRVRAQNSAGFSAYSNVDTATTLASTTAPQAPAAPGNLQAQEVSANEIDLSWQDLSTNESGFSVEMYPAGGPWAELGSVAANVKAYSATGLDPLSTYSFRVRAQNSAGFSAYSNIDTATTLAEPAPGGTGGTGGTEDAVEAQAISVVGTRTGSASDTQTMNGVCEVLSEVTQNGTNLMTWKFAFDVLGGSAVTLFVKAFQSVSTDGDNFVFAYSTDDQTYTDVLTVSKTADDGLYQSKSLPASLQGRVYIRVSDTRRVASTGSLDKISIDHLFIRSEWGGTDGTDGTGGTGGTGATEDAVEVQAISVVGTRTGSASDTQTMNGVYEVLSEVTQNGTNLMTWKFAFDVLGGSAVTLFVKAFQSVSTDGDNFVFAYSTDDQTYTDVLTVSKTADDGLYQSKSLPASLQGRVYIRVSDTRRVASTGSLDKISIDHLFIRSE